MTSLYGFSTCFSSLVILPILLSLSQIELDSARDTVLVLFVFVLIMCICVFGTTLMAFPE